MLGNTAALAHEQCRGLMHFLATLCSSLSKQCADVGIARRMRIGRHGAGYGAAHYMTAASDGMTD